MDDDQTPETILPAPGERPVFGVHRDLPAARTSPSWSPETEAMREAAYKEDLRRAVRRQALASSRPSVSDSGGAAARGSGGPALDQSAGLTALRPRPGGDE